MGRPVVVEQAAVVGHVEVVAVDEEVGDVRMARSDRVGNAAVAHAADVADPARVRRCGVVRELSGARSDEQAIGSRRVDRDRHGVERLPPGDRVLAVDRGPVAAVVVRAEDAVELPALAGDGEDVVRRRRRDGELGSVGAVEDARESDAAGAERVERLAVVARFVDARAGEGHVPIVRRYRVLDHVGRVDAAHHGGPGGAEVVGAEQIALGGGEHHGVVRPALTEAEGDRGERRGRATPRRTAVERPVDAVARIADVVAAPDQDLVAVGWAHEKAADGGRSGQRLAHWSPDREDPQDDDLVEASAHGSGPGGHDPLSGIVGSRDLSAAARGVNGPGGLRAEELRPAVGAQRLDHETRGQRGPRWRHSGRADDAFVGRRQGSGDPRVKLLRRRPVRPELQ